MPIFCTQMEVWDHVYEQLKIIDGPRFEAPTWELCEQILEKEHYTWLTITGELIADIPCKKDSFDPDWENGIDYQKIQQN